MGNNKTSAIWKFFEIVSVNEKEIDVCCLCKTTLPYKGNTTNLWFHLEQGDQLYKNEFAAILSLKQSATKRRRTESDPTRLLDGNVRDNNDDDVDANTSAASSSSNSIPI